MATVAIADAPPVIDLTPGNTTEGDASPGYVRFTRSGGNISEALVLTFTLGGTAVNGTDYAMIGTSVTIGAGDDSVDVNVAALRDNVVEASNEVVTMMITPTSNYLLEGGATSSTAVAVIIDDAPVVSVEWVADADEDGAVGMFRFLRTGGKLSDALPVDYDIAGTATAVTDYEMLDGVAVFPAGESMVAVSVAAVDDAYDEGDESVTVEVLASATNAVGVWASEVVNIIDNDGPRVEITDRAATKTAALKVAKWQDAFEVADGKVQVKGPTAGTNLDFIDRDDDRFNVWVYDKSAWDNKTTHIEAAISTENRAGFAAYDDNATAISLVRYTGNAKNENGWFWSDSQMLVSNEADDKYSSAMYLGADDTGLGTAGLPKNGYDSATTWKIGDRTHRIALDGKVKAAYTANDKHYSADPAKVAVTKIVHINASSLRDKKVSEGGAAFISEASAKQAFQIANEQFAQVGILLQHFYQTVGPLAGVDLSNGLDASTWDGTSLTLSPEEKALLAGTGGIRTTETNDVELYFINHFFTHSRRGEAFPASLVLGSVLELVKS